MLSLNKKKKIVYSALAVTALALPVSALAVNKINSLEDTYAATMPASFNDQNFYDCVLAEFQSEFPNETVASTGLTDAQLAKIAELTCSGQDKADEEKISDVTGLNKMTSLTKLGLSFQNLSEIDITSNTALTYLAISKNNISSIDVARNTSLATLAMSYNGLTGIDVSQNTSLTYLDVSHNNIAALNLTSNTQLETLGITYNKLTTLNLVNNTSLTELYAAGNQFTSLDLSHNVMLELIGLESNQLTSLDVSNNVALEKLGIQSNQLSKIDVSKNSNLVELKVDNIMVQSGVVPLSVAPEVTLDLSKLSFLEESQSFDDSDDYVYNKTSKIITVSDFGRTGGYAQISSEAANRTYKLQIPNFLMFDANGGSDASSAVICYPTVAAGSCSVTVPAVTPVRTGYEFKGYADSANAISPAYSVGSNISLTDPKIIYAVWGEKDTDTGDDTGSDAGNKEDGKDSENAAQEDGKDDVPVPNTSAVTPDTGVNTKTEENGSLMVTYALPLVVVALAGVLFKRNRSKKHIKFER